MSQLPICVQYLQAFSTPIIALMVAGIAFFQWRTEHHKVVLALFDRRVTMIDELRGIVAELIREGKVRNEDSDRFLWATKGDEFLFRAKVTSYLSRTYKLLLDLHACEAELEFEQRSQLNKGLEKRRELRNELEAFPTTFTKLVTPYVQMHQKRLWI